MILFLSFFLFFPSCVDLYPINDGFILSYRTNFNGIEMVSDE